MRTQRLVPGIIGFAPATDHVYARVMQRAAQQEGASGGVNVLRTLTGILPVIDSTRAHAGAAAQLALTGLRSRG